MQYLFDNFLGKTICMFSPSPNEVQQLTKRFATNTLKLAAVYF